MNEAVKKFKETIEKTNTIAVRTGRTDDLAKVLSAAVLHGLFLRLGKRSSIDIENYSDKTLKLLEILCKNSTLKDNQTSTERILIKLDTKKIPVEELNYEKEGDFLKIILKGKDILNTDGIIIEKEKEPVDMLILLDTPADEAEKILEKIPHRDVVKITAKERGLAQKTADLVKALYPETLTEFADPIWMLLEEEIKESKYPRAESVLLTTELEAHIDRKKIGDARDVYFDKEFWRILGRALTRSDFEKDIMTHWTFLTKTDLKKFGASKDVLISILKEIRNLRKNANYFALLWESDSENLNNNESPDRNISAIIGCGEEKLASLASAFGTSPASNYFFVNGFRAFSEAEISIRGHLRRLV